MQLFGLLQQYWYFALASALITKVYCTRCSLIFSKFFGIVRFAGSRVLNVTICILTTTFPDHTQYDILIRYLC